MINEKIIKMVNIYFYQSQFTTLTDYDKIINVLYF